MRMITRKVVVHNGYLPQRDIQTGVRDVPKVRDRAGQGPKFTSNIVPPFLKRTKGISEMPPVLYLKGLSTSDFGKALEAFSWQGSQKGLSSSTISRLKQCWKTEYSVWNQRDL